MCGFYKVLEGPKGNTDVIQVTVTATVTTSRAGVKGKMLGLWVPRILEKAL